MRTVSELARTSVTAAGAAACQDGVASRDGRFTVTPAAVIVTRQRPGGAVSASIPLDDPADVRFANLPHADLEDGRLVRRAAFDAWAANLRARLAAGAAWETTWRQRKPYHTAFAILGGTLLGGGILFALARWASSDPQVRHAPGMAEGVVLLAGVALLLWMALGSLSSAARYWLTRRGSYVRIDARGVVLARGAAPVAPSEIAAAAWHPWVRATEVRLRDGRRLWLPREPGPLVRLDLVLAALPGGPPPVV